jgi:hypothetical protein
MATEIYNKGNVYLIDGTELEIIPLKIKYVREFRVEFEHIKTALDDDAAIEILSKCVGICMKQYYPQIVDSVEDNLDLPTIYKVIDIAAGIKINKKSEEPVKEQAVSSGSSWDELDLAKLEAEVFILGIWKDYKDLEESLSMPELMVTLSSKRELDYQEKKFLAAIQGVDLEGSSNPEKGQKEWEDMKARVFSRGATSDSNDVLALQGQNAKRAGFGIGMGLDYDDDRDPTLMKN